VRFALLVVKNPPVQNDMFSTSHFMITRSYLQKFIRYIFSSLFTPMLDFILKLLKHMQRRTKICKLPENNKKAKYLKPLDS